jgi:Trypsin-co-occurring domain 1
MSTLVSYDLKDGGSVLVEVEDERGPVMRGGRTDAVVAKATESLEDVVGRIGPAVRGIVTQLREATDWPAEVTVEFSVKLSADSGVIIARTGGEANFKIALRWNRT